MSELKTNRSLSRCNKTESRRLNYVTEYLNKIPLHVLLLIKKSLKIPNELSEAVNRRWTHNIMAKNSKNKGIKMIYKTLHRKSN